MNGYDRGGFLPAAPQRVTVTNTTGRPERVLSPTEWEELRDE